MQRVAGVDQIDDGVRQAQQRGDFHRPMHGDDLHRPAGGGDLLVGIAWISKNPEVGHETMAGLNFYHVIAQSICPELEALESSRALQDRQRPGE